VNAKLNGPIAKRPPTGRPLLGRTAKWVRAIGGLVVVSVLIALLCGRIHLEAVQAYASRLNGFAAFGLLLVLPLVGFPASVLHVAAGVRFGVALGLALVALSIGLQLLASYGLVHLARDTFARRFEALRRRIPVGAHASICVFAVLLPGAPFAAINYVLPLVGVRLRTYLACCWPLHVLRSTVTVLLGGEMTRLTPTRLIVLGAYALVLTGASVWTYQRLRRQLGAPPATADDRMQPA
jgi:uncharacterized membrane protein YdjX (TVP38/TMEM64 family)